MTCSKALEFNSKTNWKAVDMLVLFVLSALCVSGAVQGEEFCCGAHQVYLNMTSVTATLVNGSTTPTITEVKYCSFNFFYH